MREFLLQLACVILQVQPFFIHLRGSQLRLRQLHPPVDAGQQSVSLDRRQPFRVSLFLGQRRQLAVVAVQLDVGQRRVQRHLFFVVFEVQLRRVQRSTRRAYVIRLRKGVEQRLRSDVVNRWLPHRKPVGIAHGRPEHKARQVRVSRFRKPRLRPLPVGNSYSYRRAVADSQAHHGRQRHLRPCLATAKQHTSSQPPVDSLLQLHSSYYEEQIQILFSIPSPAS